MYSSLPRGALSIMRMQRFFTSHCQQQQVSLLMKQTEVFKSHSQHGTLRWQWQVSDKQALDRSIRKGMNGPVFHQFNIPNISPSQADSTHLPKTTYGIQLKGSSFSKTVSFSLNFLRRSVWTCFRLKKKKKYCDVEKRSEFSQDTATFHPRCCSKVCLLSKMWANLRHH